MQDSNLKNNISENINKSNVENNDLNNDKKNNTINVKKKELLENESKNDLNNKNVNIQNNNSNDDNLSNNISQKTASHNEESENNNNDTKPEKKLFNHKKPFLFDDSLTDFVGNHEQQLVERDTYLKMNCHFGMYTKLWNPLNKWFIFGRKGIFREVKKNNYVYNHFVKIHMLDINKIDLQLIRAYNFLANLSSQNKSILFVGTQEFMAEHLQNEATRCNSFFINHYWLGGLMTNLITIRKLIKLMVKIQKDDITGYLDKLTKQEKIKLHKKYYKLKQIFFGIKEMYTLPKCVVIFFPKKNSIAIKEANKLNIPVVAVVNSGNSPKGVDWVIPCNNISRRSLLLMMTILADAVIEGTGKTNLKFAYKTCEEINPIIENTLGLNKQITNENSSIFTKEDNDLNNSEILNNDNKEEIIDNLNNKDDNNLFKEKDAEKNSENINVSS